jgi:predicted phage terminase large subunit-like protein
MPTTRTWEVIIEKAIREDGSLLFPQKLSFDFLERAKRTMGSYLFANQYLNEVIPADLQTFKKAWFNYFSEVPKNALNFIFVDPALSQADTADYTGVVVVAVDHEKHWYVRFAKRYRVTPTELISLIFDLNARFNPTIIGIEEVAFQKSLLYFLDEEMRRRNVLLPIKGIKPPTDKTKQMRILSLVPRFEWGHITLSPGLNDLELELLQFPRGAHDDLIDALASVEYIYFPPEKEKKWAKKPAPNHPDYERWFIDQQINKSNSEDE